MCRKDGGIGVTEVIDINRYLQDYVDRIQDSSDTSRVVWLKGGGSSDKKSKSYARGSQVKVAAIFVGSDKVWLVYQWVF